MLDITFFFDEDQEEVGRQIDEESCFKANQEEEVKSTNRKNTSLAKNTF